MTVHHQQNHHVAALSGVAVANNGLNLSRMSGLEAHRLENIVDRNGVAVERLSNGLDSRNNNLNNNNGLERGDASTTMPQRSRFMITDILGGASSKMHQSGLPSQEPPGSPPSTPRDLSVRHQSRTSLSNSNLDEDSDASHHDGASVTSNGKWHFITCFRNCARRSVYNDVMKPGRYRDIWLLWIFPVSLLSERKRYVYMFTLKRSIWLIRPFEKWNKDENLHLHQFKRQNLIHLKRAIIALKFYWAITIQLYCQFINHLCFLFLTKMNGIRFCFIFLYYMKISDLYIIYFYVTKWFLKYVTEREMKALCFFHLSIAETLILLKLVERDSPQLRSLRNMRILWFRLSTWSLAWAFTEMSRTFTGHGPSRPDVPIGEITSAVAGCAHKERLFRESDISLLR